MDWNKPFAVTNKSGMIVIAGTIEIHHNTENYIVDPTRHPESTIKSLQIFEQRGTISVTNDIKQVAQKAKEDFGVKKVQSIANDAGDKHDHFVFDPFKDAKSAINVSEVKMEKGIEVEEDLTSDSEKGIVVHEQKIVADEQMTKEQAIELLNSHWKKFESEVNKIDDLRKLNFLQVVAIEIGAADKKKEILENRINSL
jgi:hypothetical protein